MAKKQKVNPDQGLLNFDGTIEPDVCKVPKSYDNKRAKEAGLRRRKRDGHYALTPRTVAFMAKVSGLWIPSSASENSAVVQTPATKLHANSLMAKERVKAKYSDSSAEPHKVERWAHSAARQSARDTYEQYENYSKEASGNLGKLYYALDLSDFTYSSESIRGSDVALGGICKYFISLESFVGATANEHKGQKRVWLQDRWVHKVTERTEVAHEYMDSLRGNEIEDLYDEAIWNAWSRMKYWCTILRTEREGRPVQNESWASTVWPKPLTEEQMRTEPF